MKYLFIASLDADELLYLIMLCNTRGLDYKSTWKPDPRGITIYSTDEEQLIEIEQINRERNTRIRKLERGKLTRQIEEVEVDTGDLL